MIATPPTTNAPTRAEPLTASHVPNLLRRVAGGLEDQRWLDVPGRALQTAVNRAFEAGGAAGLHARNFLHGVWLGHPLHPVLTDVPIGAWSGAVLLDTLEVASGRRSLGAGADILVGVGVGSALITAVTGLTDWQPLPERPRRVGLVHALFNITATGLFGASWLMRRRRNRRSGRGLAVAGFVASLAGAFLGGHLVFAQRIGVNHAPEGARPEQFVPVIPVAELPEGQLRRAHFRGVPILLVRRGSRIYALAEACAHLGGPLSEGWLVDDSVVCPWHQSRYSLEDGHVIDGPSTFDQPCFETRVRNGHVEVRAGKAEPAAAPAA